MNIWISYDVLHSFSIKIIFYDKMGLRRFYFDETKFYAKFWWNWPVLFKLSLIIFLKRRVR